MEKPTNANGACQGAAAEIKACEQQLDNRSVVRRQDRCLHCDARFDIPTTGRRKRFCSDRCRKAHSRVNGQENRSDRQSSIGGENTDLAPSQPPDIVEPTCPFNQEQKPTRPRASSSKRPHFEEYPPRQKKTDKCITYKLTDGRQINTGYGRTSRPLGYVMEIDHGRWVARVKDLSSAPLPLGAAKKAAVELYESGERGEPRDWISDNNLAVAAVIDPPPSVTMSLTDDGHYDVTVKWGPDFLAKFPHVEYPEDVAAYQLHDWGHRGTFSMCWADGAVATYVKAVKRPGQPVPAPTEEQHHGPTPGALQGDDYQLTYDANGYPILPPCLDRREIGRAP